MKLLLFLLFIASTQAILLKIHAGDMAPILFLESGSSVTLHAKSTDNSGFTVWLATSDNWDVCAHSGFDLTKCYYLEGTEHSNIIDATVYYAPRDYNTVLVIRSENLIQDMEFEYSYTYNSPAENDFAGMIIITIIMCLLCLPLICVFMIGCIISSFIAMSLWFISKQSRPKYTQHVPMQVIPM